MSHERHTTRCSSTHQCAERAHLGHGDEHAVGEDRDGDVRRDAIDRL